MVDSYSIDHNLPCHNPSCKSYGKPHYNCRCYAHGGSVCASNQPHLPGCEFYAGGGQVDDTSRTKGHVAAHQGLLGLLRDVGHAKLQEPEKHARMIDEAKLHWERLQDPVDSQYEPKKTTGVRLANHLSKGEHGEAADLMHEHPMVGSVGKQHLGDIMGRLTSPLMSNGSDPEAFKASAEYLHHAIKGHGMLKSKAKSLLGPQKDSLKPDRKMRDALKSHLDDLQADPTKLLDVAGKLGHYTPDHATQVAATAATATDYLNSLKPKPLQLASLDAVIKPSRAEEMAYERQLDIAQQPLLVLQHVTDGTLLPQDLTTLKTIFPGLHKSMMDEAGEALIDAKTKNIEIPYKQKLTMSMLLEQPLDSTMLPGSMQAIMKSQGPQQAAQQQKNTPKATAVELRQINKTDELSETPLDARQISRNKK